MSTKKILIFSITILFLVPSNAQAYLDPGSGSFIIQMIIAFLASIVIFFKNGTIYIKNLILKFVNFFSKKKNFNQKLDKKFKKD